MTIVIVVTFLICWSPYFVMVSLHFADLDFATGQRSGTVNLHPAAEKFLYIFAIFNSCINPYLYGYYSFKLKPELEALFNCVCYYCCCWYFWCPHRKMRMQEGRGRYMRTLSTTQRASTIRGANRTSRGLSLDMGAGGAELTVVDDNGVSIPSTTPMIVATTMESSPQQSSRDILKGKIEKANQHIRGRQRERPPRLLINSKEIDTDGRRRDSGSDSNTSE